MQETTTTEQTFDVVIVGAGPIGLACGLAARSKNLSFIILEKGCLVNSLYNYPTNMTFFSTSEKLEIGGVPFVSNNIKPTRPEALEYYRRVAVASEMPIHLQEKVNKIEQLNGEFNLATNRRIYKSRHVIIATGFYDVPVLMNIPGEHLSKVTHYYKDPHFYAMQKVVVVGANNSAVDAALETFRKGANVTLVTRGDAIGKRVKYWVKPDIENRIKEGSIKAHFNSCLTAIQEKTVDIQTPAGLITSENDYVIAATGYKPDFEFLRGAGILFAPGEVREPLYNRETMESNIPGIYLAGVVCGGMNTHVWFIENSREHAVRIIDDIVGR